MSFADTLAGAVFIACWLAYAPLLARLNAGPGAINIDMVAVREAWLRRMLERENRMVDASLLGHQLNSASFFASTNLLLIAAAAGLLFGGGEALAGVGALRLGADAPHWLTQLKVALITITLTKGFLDFIWTIRQLNYTSALFGAAPDHADIDHHETFVRAAAQVLSPAYAAFNAGVRTYYFALAAAAWIISPWAMIAAVIGAFALLLQRQTNGEAAIGLREARRLLEAMQRRPD